MGLLFDKILKLSIIDSVIFQPAKRWEFCGRTINLISDVLQEDTTQPKGHKKIETAYQSEAVPELIIGFEGNRNLPLTKTLRAGWNPENETVETHYSPEANLAK